MAALLQALLVLFLAFTTSHYTVSTFTDRYSKGALVGCAVFAVLCLIFVGTTWPLK